MRALVLLAVTAACTGSVVEDAVPVAVGSSRLYVPRGAPDAPVGDADHVARWHLARLAPRWATVGLPTLVTRGIVDVRGGTIVRLAQHLDGLPIEGAELRVLVRGPQLIATSGDALAPTIPRDAPRFAGDEATAIARAVGPGARAHAWRAWWRVSGGSALVASWIVEAYLPDGRAVRVAMAAADGRILETRSLVDDAAFTYRVFAEPAGDKRPLDGPLADSTPHPTGMPDGVYPPFVAPLLVTVDGLNELGDPWLPAGATETSGNNADAYVDLAPPDGLNSTDFRATVTAPGVFDHGYDTTQDALASREQQEAAITQLFYTANWLHDFWYDAGFTEAAGNAQLLNYGRGGDEGDPLRLEAQDRALEGVRNNANMATPSDGLSPRMQMYIFRGIESRTLAIQPAGREPATAAAAFAVREHDVTAPLAGPVDACGPVMANVAGSIVLVQPPTCAAELAAANAQAAGAVGALVIDVVDASVPSPLDDDDTVEATITIPVFAITQAEGATLVAELAAGPVTARMLRAFTPEPDSSLDALIVAHEFGHYLHRRLATCGTKLCSATSEGWGDFVALLFASRPEDDLDGAYPVGAYATQTFSLDPAYFGVRRMPYSVDRAIDGLTFRHMADGEPLPAMPMSPSNAPNSEVHNAGEVWATALWEAYVALQKAHPGGHAAIRERMAAYVVAGLLLTPPDATPTEARDALVLAARTGDPADGETLLAAFARRGLGSCAVSPARTSGDFIGVVESMDLRGNVVPGTLTVDDTLATCDGDGLLDAGERGTARLPITNQGHRPLESVTVTLVAVADDGQEKLEVLGEPRTIGRLEPGEAIEVPFEIALPSRFRSPFAGELAVEVRAPDSCTELVSLASQFRMNGDDVPTASATDRFDAPSIWTTRQQDERPVWTQARTLPGNGAYDGRWVGAGIGTTSDSVLVSPPLVAAADAPLLVTLTHRWSFEFSDGTAWDGGLLELSVDSGATWRDVADLGAEPGYTHVLTGQSGNPLVGRRAYAGENGSYPSYEPVTLDFGTQLAGQTFQLRLRIGTDEATSAPGWEIDTIDFAGIVGTPFPSQEVDRAPCGSAIDDGGCCDAGSPPASSLLACGSFALLLRRRRRR